MGRKPNIALIFGWNDERLLGGIGRFARQAGWHLHLRHVFDRTRLSLRQVDGVIASRHTDPAVNRQIVALARRIPTVVAGANPVGRLAGDVVEDDAGAGRLAARHFLEHGHRHFAWFSLYAGTVEQRRYAGFCGGIAATGGTCTGLRWFGKAYRHSWRRDLLRALQQLPRPLALLAQDDQLAADVIETGIDAGIRIPQDLAVMGIGNISLICDCSHVPVTSVDLDLGRFGHQAAARLQDLLRHPGDRPAPCVVPAAVVVPRRSTDTLVVEDATTRKVLRHIHAHFREPVCIGDIARACGLSQRGLERAFSRTLHRPPAAYLLDLRLTQARHLLDHGTSSLQTVAAACGFGTMRTFNRCFHRQSGMSPQAWRTATAHQRSADG